VFEMKIRCPYCNEEIEIEKGGTITCPHCGREIWIEKKD